MKLYISLIAFVAAIAFIGDAIASKSFRDAQCAQESCIDCEKKAKKTTLFSCDGCNKKKCRGCSR